MSTMDYGARLRLEMLGLGILPEGGGEEERRGGPTSGVSEN